MLVEVFVQATNHAAALASCVDESLAVEDANAAAVVLDHAGALQVAGRDGNGGTASSEHLREELLRERKLRFLDTIMHHEQPASEAGFGIVLSIAGDKLHRHHRLELHEFQHEAAQDGIFFKPALEVRKRHSQAAAADLHKAEASGILRSKEIQDFGTTFVATHEDFHLRAFLEQCNERGYAGGKKVDEARAISFREDWRSKGKWNGFEA